MNNNCHIVLYGILSYIGCIATITARCVVCAKGFNSKHMLLTAWRKICFVTELQDFSFPTSMAADNLQQILEGYSQHQIYPDEWFLNQALTAATFTDNHKCIGELIKLGASNIDECIQLAQEKGSVNATAMLFLMKAALTGDKSMLHSMTSGCFQTEVSTFKHTANKHKDDNLIMKASAAVLKGRVCILAPLELAQIYGQYSVRRELLMMTHVDRHEGSIDWSDLSLVSLDTQLLERAGSWLKLLLLTSNKLKSLPKQIEVLKKVNNAKLDQYVQKQGEYLISYHTQFVHACTIR